MPRSIPARGPTPDGRESALTAAVASTMRRSGLVRPGMSLLVAVSGGPDSVALLHALHRLSEAWRLALTVVHCNYGLRGRDSAADAAFVRKLCASLSIPCLVRRVRLPEQGASPGRSVQARAREVRYRLFHELADRGKFDRVALAHTADDQAETVLLWMLRGSGLSGLCGMPIIRNGRFIRPLLETSKAEVLAFLGANGLRFRVDATNQQPRYRRNRIRHEVLPLLKEMNPAIVRTLVRQADLLRADEAYLRTVSETAAGALTTSRADGAVEIDRSGLLALPLALRRRVVRAVLQRGHQEAQSPSMALVSAILDRVVKGRSGATLHLPGLTVSRAYRQIVFDRASGSVMTVEGAPGESSCSGVSASPDEMTVLPRLGRWTAVHWLPTEQVVRLRLRTRPAGRGFRLRSSRTRVFFDADRVTFPLCLRIWNAGDWFCPAGMGGHRKKLQDFWTDEKVPRRERATEAVLTAPEGILWVVGRRADERFQVGAATKKLLIAEVIVTRR